VPIIRLWIFESHPTVEFTRRRLHSTFKSINQVKERAIRTPIQRFAMRLPSSRDLRPKEKFDAPNNHSQKEKSVYDGHTEHVAFKRFRVFFSPDGPKSKRVGRGTTDFTVYPGPAICAESENARHGKKRPHQYRFGMLVHCPHARVDRGAIIMDNRKSPDKLSECLPNILWFDVLFSKSIFRVEKGLFPEIKTATQIQQRKVAVHRGQFQDLAAKVRMWWWSLVAANRPRCQRRRRVV
jgi:hypothetical protein